ncbi:MAG: 4-(cytidine 5'-diphospho)-2-C-methyl-D-erythritol kinase [Dysgonamonadaceae bacterium]|nr:4-(cytidine 5'-diphospho)-2-C-methyl-D-erythritol kinase [Dysgonamonadaceae bacterium]
MIAFPNAKINLGLNIVSKRTDGYHNIETLFYPVDLCDVLEIVPVSEKRTRLIQSGIPVDGDPEKNLVMKAYRLLKQSYDLPEIDIYLRKNIPFGAGLGGGSADAAFMLKLLNEFAGLQLPDKQLENFAAQLGADCPFFIRNRPVFAEGIGTEFSPVDISLNGYFLVLVKPNIHVSTQEAYAAVKPKLPQQHIMDCIRQPVSSWKECLVNDFEISVFAKYSEIGKIKQQLYDLGAVYAAMSGSGSSVFGIFETETNVTNIFPDCTFYSLLLR